VALGFSGTIDHNKLNKAINSYHGATDTLGSSKPNPTKKKFKDSIKDYIVNFKEYSRLEELERKLIVENND
jgi:hypothetical protein